MIYILQTSQPCGAGLFAFSWEGAVAINGILLLPACGCRAAEKTANTIIIRGEEEDE